MPHASLKLIPGVDENRTPALNEAAISYSNLIRFMPDRQGIGLPQKLGGWQKFIQSPLPETVRALHSWSDTNDNQYLAAGTIKALYTSLGQAGMIDRSPQQYTIDVPVLFTTNTTPGTSYDVLIEDDGSNVSSYDAIFLETPVSVGGLVLSGFYPCIAETGDSYKIIARNILGIPVSATSDVVGGGAVPSFTTTTSPPSPNVEVTLANHGYTPGSTFTILVPTEVGGLTLYGNYLVLAQPEPTADTFYISGSSAASSADTVEMNGGNARITYYIGQKASSPPAGYGSGSYGAGAYGTGVTFSAGRTYTGVSISSSGGTATAVLAGMNVTAGSTVQITGTTSFNSTYIVKTSSDGSFTFAASGTHTAQTGTVTVTDWYFDMPDTALPDWALDNWGEYLIASPHNGAIYYWNPSASDHCNIMPYAPLVNEGCFVAMPERQIVAYGSSFTGVKDPMLVRWCDIGDFADWIGTVTNQAGSFRIPKGSKIVGGMQGPQQGLLWTDIGVWSMQYINQPLIYSFNELGAGCGLVSRKAAGVLSGTVYWMSQSQFFRLSGGGVEVVPCPIWDVIFQNLDFDYIENVRCAPNSRFGEISWYYPTISSKGTSTEGQPSRYVKYNAILNQWDYGSMTRTAWIDQGVFGPPMGTGNRNYVQQHETSPDADGTAMLSSFQTGYFALQEGDLKTFVDQVWADMKWGEWAQDQNASVQITFYAADYPGQDPQVYGPYTVTQTSPNFVTPRLRARLLSIKISSSDIGSFWRLGNIRYRFQPDGKF